MLGYYLLRLGRSPGGGKGYPLQYSGLENSRDYTVHGVTKSRTQLSDFHFLHTKTYIQMLIISIIYNRQKMETIPMSINW